MTPAPRKSNAATSSADVWRVTADDDPEKQWDSDNSEDAGWDAAFAFEAGARKVTIERISPPNDPSSATAADRHGVAHGKETNEQ
jgi:hypothetical protein